MSTSVKKITTWNDELTEKFINLCVSQVKAGSRPNTKNVLANILEEMQLSFNTEIDLKQLKNKWDTLRKEWRLWNRLVGNEAGLGWNLDKKTIEATDEWWDAKIKEVPAAAKFREKGLALPDEMKLLFGDVIPTGLRASTSSSGALREQPEVDISLEGWGDSEDGPPTTPLVDASAQISEVGGKEKRKSVESSTSSQQAKKMRSLTISVKALHELSHVIGAVQGDSRLVYCVKILDSLDFTDDMQFYYDCLRLLTNTAEARTMLLLMTNHESQMAYLRTMIPGKLK